MEGIFIYKLILTLHVLTVIIGIGHTFLYPSLLKMPNSKAQIDFTINWLSKTGKIAKISDYILIGSGISLLFIGNHGFKFWVWAVLFLLIILRLSSYLISNPFKLFYHSFGKKKEKEALKEYKLIVRKLLPILLFEQTINVLIIVIMIIKPTFSLF